MSPDLKLLILLFLSSAAVFTSSWTVLLLIFIYLIVSIIFSPPKRNLKNRIKPLFVIFIFILLFQVLFNTGITVPERVYLGLFIGSKIFLLSFLVFSYLNSTSPSEIIGTLSFLPKQLLLMVTITFSLIPVIFEEYRKIFIIQSSRGHKFTRLNIFGNYIPLIIPLIHRSLLRAEQISLVIISRGYKME